MNKNMAIGISLMILSSLCTCLGQVMWKLAASSPTSWYYLIGFVLYGFGALIMMIAFQFGELSVLHPILSVGFIASIFLGAWLFQEAITLTKLLGVLLIVIGVIVMCQKQKREIMA